MRYGYARISTKDQCLDLQIDALKKFGCEMLNDNYPDRSASIKID